MNLELTKEEIDLIYFALVSVGRCGFAVDPVVQKNYEKLVERLGDL